MKRLLNIFIWLTLSVATFAQTTDLQSVADQMNKLSRDESLTSKTIASYITNNFTSREEQMRAAYYWVINNIRYSTDSMYIFNWETTQEEKVTATLRRKRGVCTNFAVLFNDLMKNCGFDVILIEGLTRQYGAIDKNGHSWSAVRLGDQWRLFDPTWDAGSGSTVQWFGLSPTDFIDSHFPFDPLLQFLKPYITEATFLTSTLDAGGYTEEHTSPELSQYLTQTPAKQFESKLSRMDKSAVTTKAAATEKAVLKMRIATLEEEKASRAYAGAVDKLNEAVRFYNQVLSTLHDKSISKSDRHFLLEKASTKLAVADSKISVLVRLKNNQQYNPEALIARISDFRRKIQVQQDALKPTL